MFAKRIYLTLFITALLTLMVTVAGAQNQASPKGKLEGTWLVTATFTDPPGIPPFKVLFTFMPGRSDNEGTLIDTNEFQLTPNPVCTPDQGVWQRVSGREFIATHYNFCFDALQDYIPAGPTKVRDVLGISDAGDVLTGRQYIEGFDTAGNIVFIGKVSLQGTRVRAEPPPAQ